MKKILNQIPIALFTVSLLINCTGNYSSNNRQMSKGYLTFIKNISSLLNFKTKESQEELDLKFYNKFDSFIDGFSNRAIKSNDIKNIITNYYQVDDLNLLCLLVKCFPIKDSVICSILTNKNFNLNSKYFSKLFLKSCFLRDSKTHKILLQSPYSFKVEDIYTSNNSYKTYIINEKYRYFKDTLKLPLSFVDKLKKKDTQVLWEYNIYDDINQYINGTTLLNLTGRYGNQACFKKLYYNNYNLNIFKQDKVTGATVLDNAAKYHKEKFIDFLKDFLREKQRNKLGNLSNSNEINAMRLLLRSSNDVSELKTFITLMKKFNINMEQKYKDYDKSCLEHFLSFKMVYGPQPQQQQLYQQYFDNLLVYPIEILKYKITESILKIIENHKHIPDTSPINKYKNVEGGPSKYAMLEYLYKQKQKQLYPEKTF